MFWKSIGSWKLIRHSSCNPFHQLTIQSVVSPYPRPPVSYNCCVSVFQACNARIEPTTLQLIDETCTSRYSAPLPLAGLTTVDNNWQWWGCIIHVRLSWVVLFTLIIIIIIKTNSTAQVGKTKLFINCLRNPTSTCSTENWKPNSGKQPTIDCFLKPI